MTLGIAPRETCDMFTPASTPASTADCANWEVDEPGGPDRVDEVGAVPPFRASRNVEIEQSDDNLCAPRPEALERCLAVQEGPNTPPLVESEWPTACQSRGGTCDEKPLCRNQ